MAVLAPGTYAQWRAQNESRFLLREPAGPLPPETLLQSVWHHQRLRRDQLKTIDGRPVRILHPGFWNHGAGPDFRGAVIQIGSDPARAGDVEIDLTAGNWKAHHHDGNPNFANVLLHVIWKREPDVKSSMAVMGMEEFLDAPLADIQTWAKTAAIAPWPETLRGVCSSPLSALRENEADGLLRQAALVRFQRKATEIEARARQTGWEQSLWEGLFRALGYKQNVWPMLRIAELVPHLVEDNPDLLTLQARLFGVAGFMQPSEKGHATAYEHALWNCWWRDRERFQDFVLPKSTWRKYGLRPANQPQRRLALAAHWLVAKDFTPRLESWFTNDTGKNPLPQSLLQCLQPQPDDFWSWHWTVGGARLLKPQPLLGEARATDLAINVILPWFWTRARAGKNAGLERQAEERFLAWPAAEDNSLLRLARQRLFGGQRPPRSSSAAGQQGILQIVRDFCDHSNAICTDCLFPGFVRTLATTGERR